MLSLDRVTRGHPEQPDSARSFLCASPRESLYVWWDAMAPARRRRCERSWATCSLLQAGIEFQGGSLVRMRTDRIAQLGIGYALRGESSIRRSHRSGKHRTATWTRLQGRDTQARIALAYQVFPKLREYAGRGGNELSGGERKMLSIARALALDPQLLLLDEPFEGLSPAIIPAISEGIASIRGFGHGILIAESNVHHVPEYADTLYVLERGEIIFGGKPADARASTDVMQVISGAA